MSETGYPWGKVDTKTITITNCKTCPYSKTVHNGKQRLCQHVKIQVRFPYEEERMVNDFLIADFCPLG